MLALPISMVISLALGFLLLRSLLTERRPWPIPALLSACVLQGVINALAQYYGWGSARALQPITATVIPPLAWIAFQATVLRPVDPRRDLVHGLAPILTAFCVAVAPGTLDIVVPGIFAVYGLAILQRLRSGADAVPMARLEAGDWPHRIWRGIALALLLSAASDWVIAAAHLLGQGWLQSWIISAFTSLSLLLIGACGLSKSLGGKSETSPPASSVPGGVEAGQDAEIMRRLEGLLTGQALFLDPDLTLLRLGRRLGLPSKHVSAAVNRVTGDNVSRYVNAHRIRHACQRLKAGSNVTAAMLDSGFNTKSNFNREFLRVTGLSPTVWLAQAAASAACGKPRLR